MCALGWNVVDDEMNVLLLISDQSQSNAVKRQNCHNVLRNALWHLQFNPCIGQTLPFINLEAINYGISQILEPLVLILLGKYISVKTAALTV